MFAYARIAEGLAGLIAFYVGAFVGPAVLVPIGAAMLFELARHGLT